MAGELSGWPCHWSGPYGSLLQKAYPLRKWIAAVVLTTAWFFCANFAFAHPTTIHRSQFDRQMAQTPAAVLTGWLPAVEMACGRALSEAVHSADVIVNLLARQRDPGPSATILTPEALTLRHAPIADCARHERLRRQRSWKEPQSST